MPSCHHCLTHFELIMSCARVTRSPSHCLHAHVFPKECQADFSQHLAICLFQWRSCLRKRSVDPGRLGPRRSRAKARANSGRSGTSSPEQIVLHTTSGFLKKYTDIPTVQNDQSSAPWKALEKPEQWISAEALAQVLEPANTERPNRPAAGLSELAAKTLRLVFVEKKTFFTRGRWQSGTHSVPNTASPPQRRCSTVPPVERFLAHRSPFKRP